MLASNYSSASSSPPRCYPVREAVSNGVLQGDDPTHFALPLLVIQIALVLVTTRTLAFLIKPFHQPRVLAEVIGGVLLGPSGLGRSKLYLDTLFPKPSLTIIDTVSTLGLLFFLFMVGLELDLKEIRRCGRSALLTALSGVAVPFTAGIGLAVLVHQSIMGGGQAGRGLAPLVVFMGVPISITAFPVLVRIMAERKLLGTELGRIVLPAAAINDVCAWILLAVGVALSAGPGSSPATPAYVLLCGIGYVAFMLFVVRRAMAKVAQQMQSGGGAASEMCVCVTLVAVLIAGFTTDAIGIHPLFGAFVFGLVVPKHGRFAQMLTEKIEDFVTVLMLPLFFASSGLKTNLGSINSAKAVAILLLVVITATVGKISATVTAGLLLKLDLRKAFAFGFLMNTKGLVELIVLNIGKDIGVFDDQTFAILVLTCLIILFFTTPAVMALYEPARTPLPYVYRKLDSKIKETGVRVLVLVCVHGSRGIPALLNLLEALTYYKGAAAAAAAAKAILKPARPALKLYAMRLIELSGRTSSIMSLSRAQTLAEGGGDMDDDESSGVVVAFKAYGRFAKVPVKLLTAVSTPGDMHEDVCKAAAARRTNLIILPYLYHSRDDGSVDSVHQTFSAMYLRILQHSPCSVGILVDRGLWGSLQLSADTCDPLERTSVAVLFFGGPDDREALAFGLRLADHPSLQVVVIRFVSGSAGGAEAMAAAEAAEGRSYEEEGKLKSGGVKQATPLEQESMLDEGCLVPLKEMMLQQGGDAITPERYVLYEEQDYDACSNLVEAVTERVRRGEYALVVLGRGRHAWEAAGVDSRSELGILGDGLAAAGGDVKASFMVVHQHTGDCAAAAVVVACPLP